MDKKLIILILVVIAVLAGLYFLLRNDAATPNPNGSDQTVNWLTETDSSTGATFRYPESFGTRYIQPVDWPPATQVLNEEFSCTEAGDATQRAGRTDRRIIDGKQFCVTEITEGAAGTIYTQYAYAFEEDGRTVILNFTTRHPQCSNYPEEEMGACEEELREFDLDALIGEISETVTLSRVAGENTEAPENSDQNSYQYPTPQTPAAPPYQTPAQACTLEAKLCPDGSYVGRTGPNCEFAPCPSQ